MENDSSTPHDALAELPKQTIADGVGKEYHRIYETRFKISDESFEKLLHKFFCDINYFVPQLIANFRPLCAEGAKLKVGDDIDIRIKGPWNGPVRVAQVDRTRLLLVTLKGHLEAGKIQFQFVRVENSEVVFRIESFAKSKNRIVDFLYDKLPISRFMQREMWVAFCEKVADEAKKIEVGDPAAEFPIAVVDDFTEIRKSGTAEWKPL